MRWGLFVAAAGLIWRRTAFVGAVAIMTALVGCSSQPDGRAELLVFAATSLTNALGDVEEAFEGQGGADVVFSFGGSQMLAQQIVGGAPADVFISAGEFPVDFLVRKGEITAVRADLLSNRLVLVQRDGSDVELSSISQLATSLVERIAVADPDLAPAGRYATESLVNLGLWAAIEGKVVMGPDVRATLAYVESGNADVALVYVTDARLAQGVRLLDIIPQDSYSPVVYPAVLIGASGQKDGARDFIAFLEGEEASEIFRRYGFSPLE